MPQKNTISAYLPYVIIAVPVVAGMFLDVMDIDSSQYAAISKEMFETGSYLQVHDRGQDYLDKPPLLFWISSVMYSFFGVHHVVFRLFPVLVSFLGVWATYRFTALYYDQISARYASLIFGSCQAFFLMNHDVRTDTMLTGFTICAIWFLSRYVEKQRWHDLITGFACLGMALLAKGPIGLMVPALGLGTHLLMQKKWKRIFDAKYIVGLLIICLMLLPMCIGLYFQFDAHPEKESGLYFYFWKQSFGRLTGENDWNNNPPATFLLENFLWSFLPWTLIFITAFVNRTIQIIKTRVAKLDEYISFFGFLLPFLALSTSKYQLPHYIFILFPLAAVLLAAYLRRNEDNQVFMTRIKIAQSIVLLLVIAVMFILGYWSFPGVSYGLMILLITSMTCAAYFLIRSNDMLSGVIMPSVIFISGLNLYLNTHFYPNIFRYQSGSVVGRFIKTNPEINPSKVAIMGENLRFHSVDFYSGTRAPYVGHEADLKANLHDTTWLYTDEKGLSFVKKMEDVTHDIILDTSKFHISTLNGRFLNPETRHEACESVYLIKIVTSRN